MNKYLVEITKYFGDKIEFVIEAEDKVNALEKAKHYVKSSYKFDGYRRDTIKVVKKLQKNIKG